MSTLNVNYNYNTFKVRVKPSTNLNDVLGQSLTQFKLNKGSVEENDTHWTLLHKEKSITMDLPWRLLNLPAGCTLELVPVSSSDNLGNKGKNTAKDLIKIRFQVSGKGSVVREVDVSDGVINTLLQLDLEKNWDIISDKTDLKIRVLSSIYTPDSIRGKNFQDLGIKESISINVDISYKQDRKADSPVEINSDDNMEVDEEYKTKTPSHELHKPTVYLPSSDKLVISGTDEGVGDDDEIYELSVEQARRYQNILSKQTGNLGGPLMTRRMREDKMKETKEKNRKRITECLVRVKFPDRTFLEIAFKPEEAMHNVYMEVTKSLRSSDLLFELYQTHPHVLLKDDDQLLVDELKFGMKNVVLLEPVDANIKGPFLKERMIKEAKPISETLQEDVKDTQNGSAGKKSTPGENSVEKPKAKRALKGVPKWLRLSKK